MKNSRLATGFIVIVGVSGLTMLISSALRGTALHQWQFLSLLALGAVTSRAKVKLPGIDGTMSVNLPFILIAAVQLSLFEALTVALVSAALQSIPQRGGEFKPVKMLFNASTMVLASGTGSMLLHSAPLTAMQRSGAVAVVAGCGVFFVMNTLPVATIIAITEGTRVFHIWSNIAHLSFPFYVASTGITFMVTMVSQRVGWQQPLAILPVMLLMYRSYRQYFQERAAVTETTTSGGLARAASAR